MAKNNEKNENKNMHVEEVGKLLQELVDLAEKVTRIETELQRSRNNALSYSSRNAVVAGYLLIAFNNYLREDTPEEFKATVMTALGFDRKRNTELSAYEMQKEGYGWNVNGEVK